MDEVHLSDIRINKFRSLARFVNKTADTSEGRQGEENNAIIRESKIGHVLTSALTKSFISKTMVQKAKIVLNTTLKDIRKEDVCMKRFNSSSIFRKFEKNICKAISDIPCGIETYSLLKVIHDKDQIFHVPLPQTMIFNCGFENPVQILSSPKLKFKPIQDLGLIKKIICSIGKDILLESKSSIPIFVLKFRGSKRLEYSLNDLLENFPSPSIDCMIQKYIKPKGLKAIKYRVVINTFKKVIIFSNKIRIDAKNDDFQQREHYKQDRKPINLDRTLAMHKEIAREIKGNDEWKNLKHKRSISEEKVSVFNIFYNNPEKRCFRSRQEANIKASTRFLTHSDENKTNLFEGKVQSFAEIIQITEYLKEKIDNYYLDNSRLVELAVDFLQDANGGWNMLKIKYGKIERKSQDVRKIGSFMKIKKKKLILKTLCSITNTK